MRKIYFRRRSAGKTDYKARLALLKSNKPRLVIRKTNHYMVAQIIKSKEAQDAVICSANSKDLLKYGWPFSLHSIPAAYLTGFLLSTKAKSKIKEAVLDIGLQRSTKGSRIYATLKGFIDGGISINYNADILPTEERIKGKHIKDEADKIAQEQNKIKEKIKMEK